MPSTPFDPDKLEFDADFAEEDTDSGAADPVEAGEGGSDAAGVGTFDAEGALWWMDTNFKKEIREGERKLGEGVPFTDEPRNRQRSGMDSGERLQGHPLFADTSQFQGIFEDKNNPSPANNPDAVDSYNDHQNKLALAKANRLKAEQDMALRR